MPLSPLVEALGFVSPRHKIRHVLPVSTREVFGVNVSFLGVGDNGPIQELGLLFVPVPLGGVFPRNQLNKRNEGKGGERTNLFELLT